MDEKQLQLLFNTYAKGKGFQSYDEFKALMLNDKSRKIFFDASNSEMGFKDFGEFDSVLQVKKKEAGAPSSTKLPASDFATPSTTKSDAAYNAASAFENKFAKKFGVKERPRTIQQGVQKDKEANSTAAAIWNSVVGGVGSALGGIAASRETFIPKEVSRSIVEGAFDNARSSASSKEYEEKLLSVDLKNKSLLGNVKAMALGAPRMVADLGMGFISGGTSFFFQGYESTLKELESNPEAKKMSEVGKLAYLFTASTASMALDKVGLGSITKSTGIKKKIQNKIVSEVLDEFAKKGTKATVKDVEQAIVQKAASFATKIKRVGVKAATGFGSEALTGAGQQITGDATKLVANKLSSNGDIFDEKDLIENAPWRIASAGLAEGVGGAAFGAAGAAMSSTRKAIRNQIAEGEGFEKIQQDINEQVELGNITPEEAEAAGITAKQYAEIAAKIPAEIDADKKYKIIGGIEQREHLVRSIENAKQEMSSLDPAFHAEPKARIELLEAKLAQTNDYIDAIVSGKKPEYKKDGDNFVKVDSEGNETKISKEHYEIAKEIKDWNVGEEGGTKMTDKEQSDLDAEIEKSQERLSMPESPEIQLTDDANHVMQKIGNGEPVLNDELDLLSEELYRRYKALSGTKESATRRHTRGQIDATLRGLENQITELENHKNRQAEAEGEFIPVDKSKFGFEPMISEESQQPQPEMTEPQQPEVPQEKNKEYDDFQNHVLETVANVADSKFDFGISLSLGQSQREQALRNIREGKTNTKAAQTLLAEVKKMYDEGFVYLNRGRGNSSEAIQIPIKDYMAEVGKMREVTDLDELNTILGEESFNQTFDNAYEYETKRTGEDAKAPTTPERTAAENTAKDSGSSSKQKPVTKESKPEPKPESAERDSYLELAKELEAKGSKKAIADRIRAGKISKKGGLRSEIIPTFGLPERIVNKALDFIADQVEKGTKLGNAVAKAMKWVDEQMAGKKWDKSGFGKHVTKVYSMKVNGKDEVVMRDDSKEAAKVINGFYSPLEQRILDVKDQSLPANKWLERLKSDEAKWTGVQEFLESKGNEKVTKAELKDFMENNRVEIVEVVRGVSARYERQIAYDLEAKGYEYNWLSDGESLVIYKDKNEVEYDEVPTDIQKLFDELEASKGIQGSGGTKYHQYQLPGEKENYREVLVTLPKNGEDRRQQLLKLDLQRGLTDNEKAEYQSLVNKSRNDPAPFRSNHWEEPNILVHLRMNTRVDAEGRKVLFIEESQSDWGQKGKREGFKKGISEYNKKIAEITNELGDKYKILAVKGAGDHLHFEKHINGVWHWLDETDDLNVPEQRAKQLIREAKDLHYDTFENLYATEPAAFVTDTNSWAKLGLKTALKYAVGEGAERLAWTTGEQQNERYDLSKSVNSIQYAKSGDKYLVSVTDKNGNEIMYNTQMTISEVEAHLGKDIAEKIQNGAGEEKPAIQRSVSDLKALPTIEGDGLKMGGKGMKGFYGEPSEGKEGIIGGVAKALVKELTGKDAKIVETKIDTAPPIAKQEFSVEHDPEQPMGRTWLVTNNEGDVQGRFNNRSDAMERMRELTNASEDAASKGTTTQHSIEITPELKESVKQGMPLFGEAKTSDKIKELASAVRGLKTKSDKLQANIFGIPEAIYNGALETIATALEAGAELYDAIKKGVEWVKAQADTKDFDEKGFLESLRSVGNSDTDTKNTSGRKDTKGILSRLAESDNISPETKEKFKAGLKYVVKSQSEARRIAKEIISEYDIDDAVFLAEAGRFHGDVNSMIFAEALDQIYNEEKNTADSKAKNELAERWADIATRYDEAARSQGRFISAINDFYKRSPLGVQYAEQAKRQRAFQEWFAEKEKDYKEVFEAIKDEPDVKAIIEEKVQERIKQERAVNRMKRRKNIENLFDSQKMNKGGKTMSSIVPPPIWDAAIEVMKQAALAGESVYSIIEKGVAHIKKSHGKFDEDSFRADWEKKLEKMDGDKKTPLTDEEKKNRILEKFRKKLKGLSDREKEDVIRRSFKQLVENGALEYDDFKKIVADVMGLGSLSPEAKQQMEKYIADINALTDLEKKALEAKTEAEAKKALDEYYKGHRIAEKSSTELAAMLYNKPDIANRIGTIIQLKTLTLTSLIKNPFYNIVFQASQRFPVAFTLTILDGSVYGVSKILTGKPIMPDYNIFAGQGQWVSKFALGWKESITQIFTGTTNKDYFQKEIYSQQIKPATSLRELNAWRKGELHLSGAQVADKILQATPTLGAESELIARLLNVGDKPFRFSAEGATAAVEASRLGLKGVARDLFMAFPKEMAKRHFLSKGMSEDAADSKADVVERRIISEGEQATQQQDNLFSKLLEGVGQAYSSIIGERSPFFDGAGKIVGKMLMPFRKIPLNAAWSFANLAVPEIALVQGLVFAAKAAHGHSKGSDAARLDLISAKKWLATAGVGYGLMAATKWLFDIGAVTAGEDDEESKKERDAKKLYSRGNSVNVTKAWRAMKGGSIEDEEGDLLVDNTWLGNIGLIADMHQNVRAKMSPEQRNEAFTLFNNVGDRLGYAAFESIDKGVFSGYMTAITAYTQGGGYAGNLGMNMINMAANLVQGGTSAQLDRANIPYEYRLKADNFQQELNNNMASRSKLYRKITGSQPPAAVSIWGDRMDRKTSPFLLMLGMEQLQKDNFAQPLWDEFKKTENLNLFPPSVQTTMSADGERLKLTSKEYAELATFVGQARKNRVAPFLNNQASMFLNDNGVLDSKKFSEMTEPQRVDALQLLYKKGYADGKELFFAKYPNLKPKEKDPVDKVIDNKASEINNLLNQ